MEKSFWVYVYKKLSGWMIDALVWAFLVFWDGYSHGVMSLREKIFEHSRHAHWWEKATLFVYDWVFTALIPSDSYVSNDEMP